MGIGGLALRTVTTILYTTAFFCSLIVLGIYGYFMAAMARNHMHSPNWVRGTTGLSGATAAYLLFAVLLTCFLGAHKLFGWLATLLNIVFLAAFIALASLTRDGAHRCRGRIRTPVGVGNYLDDAPGISNYRYACRLNKVAFAVSVIGAGTLLFTIPFQFCLMRHRQHEKHRHVPTGTTEKRPFWNRKKASPAPVTSSYNPAAVESGYTKPATGYHTTTGTAATPYPQTGTATGY